MAEPGQAGDLIAVALRVASAIESVGGEYFVGGSVASSLQGEPRATNDLDIVLTLPLGRIPAFAETLGPDFEVDTDMLHHALLTGSTANIFFLPGVLKIDLFAIGNSAFDEAEFARRRPVVVRETGDTLVLKSPEDTVLRKLLWYRDGGGVSERQWRDLVQVLRISGAALDEGYLNAWATRLDLVELLERARSSSRSFRSGSP